jgi:hypothetical protein
MNNVIKNIYGEQKRPLLAQDQPQIQTARIHSRRV